jgi:hypothetical protein
MLMTLRSKCPDCSKEIEKTTLIYPEEGIEGDLVVECLNTGCRKLFAVRWRLSVKTKSYKVGSAADMQFQVELKEEEEQGGGDEP